MEDLEYLSIYHPSNLHYTQERLSRYQSGGYHSVCLGDTFKDGRYKIYHKLGWGGFSTVWLADDTERNQWVSIKIMTADCTKRSQELRNLQLLAKHGEGDLSSRYIVQLLDSFIHQGPNGSHQCLVFELLGPSVDIILEDYHSSGDQLEPEIIMKLSEQLLEGIAFIHDAGLGHGDISGRNIAFSCSHLSTLKPDSLYEVLGTPESEDLVRLDGKPLDKGLPKHLVKAASWEGWVDEDEEDLRILDLGEAFPQGAKLTSLAQPGPLRVPETIFVGSFDYRVDLWRAGCMIYSFIFGVIPFQYLGEDDVLVVQMIDFLGSFPAEWQKQWDCMRLNSEYMRSLTPENAPLQQSKLEQRFNERVTDPILKSLLPVIQGLMRFMPSDRISASRALDLLRSGK